MAGPPVHQQGSLANRAQAKRGDIELDLKSLDTAQKVGAAVGQEEHREVPSVSPETKTT